jgi:hypothetical protein
VPAGKVENGIIFGLDWFPTFLAAALRVCPAAGGELVTTAIEYPPMQRGASFNLDAVKAKIAAARAAMSK